eukprot:4617803-Prymnesium_polylepis.1
MAANRTAKRPPGSNTSNNFTSIVTRSVIICGCPESRVGTCRALRGYDAGTRGTDPRPNAPLP